ncbi:hypothetical protein MN032_04745 [Agromyces atrinae]|uniref:hypothetical protein n=1 Tax=Agromyces atrinae TaxID=592376 RepID=UPI001F59BE4A|nr:hypothetical protein [Agromyces atrinae]MCI2956991.1 hypothetical protein [Agromyces atrinae]
MAPVLGLSGLGLAVLGTVLACIPATFLFGVVVLIASFVVSVIGLFTRNAAKWPSIVAMILSVTGGVIGTIVTLIIVAASIAGPSLTPPAEPAPSAPETSSPPADTASERPSPEEISIGVEQLALAGGMTAESYPPDFFLCMGQYFYDSELSDEALQSTAAGQDIVDAERDVAIEVSTEAALSCDP